MSQSSLTRVALTAANISKWLAWGPVTIQSFHGMNNQGTALYIQLHETPPLANGTLPNALIPAVKSFQVAANAPFAFENINISVEECFLVISTTEANYTAVAANGGLDMTIFCQSQFMCDGTETVVGDTSTNVNVLQVFSEATGAASNVVLIRLDVNETGANQSFVLLEATDADSPVPNDSILPLAANSKLFTAFNAPSFGIDGQNFRSIDGPGATIGTVRKGLTVRIVKATAAGYLPAFPWSGSYGQATIRAIYKSPPSNTN